MAIRTTSRALLASLLVVSSEGHGYITKPISRNAVGVSGLGYCTWSGNIPCFGDAMSLGGTTGPDATGCKNAGRSGFVGSTGLSFGNTGIKTTYNAGEIIDIEIKVTAYHGGKFEFRIQDVGSANDPDGSKWPSIAPLPVVSFTPVCSGCPVEPCSPYNGGRKLRGLQQSGGGGTCAQIPLKSNGGMHTIKVRLPDDLSCEHCVLQWHWTSSNSCSGGLACSASEQFWNCADLEIVGDGFDSPVPSPTSYPSPVPTANPTLAPTPNLTPTPNAPPQDSMGYCGCHEIGPVFGGFCEERAKNHCKKEREWSDHV